MSSSPGSLDSLLREVAAAPASMPAVTQLERLRLALEDGVDVKTRVDEARRFTTASEEPK